MKHKYQIGDWVINNFEIKQITRMEDRKVCEVSCGTFATSSSDMTPYIRPLTLRSKRYAESIKYYYNELNKIPGSRALNWPDINRYFSKLCLEAIDNQKIKYTEAEVNSSIEEAQNFFFKTKDAIEGITEIDGIRLLKN